MLWRKKQVQNEWQPILDFWFRMHFMPRMRNQTLGFWVAGVAIALISAASPGLSVSLARPAPQSSASDTGGAAGSSHQNSINAELARAIQLHQSGHFDEAIRQYRLFLKEQPGNFIALANLGAALAHEGRYEEAIEEYEKALKISPDNPGVEFNLALAHYKALQLEEAVSEFNHLYTIAPGNLKIALLLGDCYFRLGEYKKIVALLGPPRTASSRLNLAQALNSLGTTLAPKFGGMIILSVAVLGAAEVARMPEAARLAYRARQAALVQGPYLGLAAVETA